MQHSSFYEKTIESHIRLQSFVTHHETEQERQDLKLMITWTRPNKTAGGGRQRPSSKYITSSFQLHQLSKVVGSEKDPRMKVTSVPLNVQTELRKSAVLSGVSKFAGLSVTADVTSWESVGYGTNRTGPARLCVESSYNLLIDTYCNSQTRHAKPAIDMATNSISMMNAGCRLKSSRYSPCDKLHIGFEFQTTRLGRTPNTIV